MVKMFRALIVKPREILSFILLGGSLKQMRHIIMEVLRGSLWGLQEGLKPGETRARTAVTCLTDDPGV